MNKTNPIEIGTQHPVLNSETLFMSSPAYNSWYSQSVTDRSNVKSRSSLTSVIVRKMVFQPYIAVNHLHVRHYITGKNSLFNIDTLVKLLEDLIGYSYASSE